MDPRFKSLKHLTTLQHKEVDDDILQKVIDSMTDELCESVAVTITSTTTSLDEGHNHNHIES